MAAAVPTLSYFNGVGRVYALRIALYKAFGKDGCIDKRVAFPQWPETKKAMPLGQMPVLEVNGMAITQADAIAR